MFPVLIISLPLLWALFCIVSNILYTPRNAWDIYAQAREERNRR